MEISGKVISLQPEQTGNGRNGAWRKRDFILETNGKYPKKVCISVWGEKIDQFNLNEGQTVTASVEVESREYNGKWYTDVKAWKVGKQEEDAQDQIPAIPITAYSKEEMDNAGAEEEVPFW